MNLNDIAARVQSIANGLTYNESPREAEAKHRLYALLSGLGGVSTPAATPAAESNPAGTPGVKVDVSRLADASVKLTPEQKAGNPLRVTVGGVPVQDQAAGVQAFLAAGLRKEPATVQVTPPARDTHQLCVRGEGGSEVGDIREVRVPTVFGSWVPCDKDGWVSVGMPCERPAPGLPIVFDSERNAWRLALPGPKSSALDEMAAQAASWHEKRAPGAVEPDDDGTFQGRTGVTVGVDPAHGADTMAYMLRSHRKPAPAPAGIDATLAERGSRYGKFEDHAAITMQLKDALHQRIYENTTKFQADQLEAIDMICHKLGRIVNGDPNYADSWVDIAGYAKLVADRLEGVSK